MYEKNTAASNLHGAKILGYMSANMVITIIQLSTFCAAKPYPSIALNALCTTRSFWKMHQDLAMPLTVTRTLI